MEVPNKIYMTPSFGEPDNVLLASFSKSHLDFHRDIEYTRTDAFIEKACDYLQKNIWRIIFEENEFRQRFVTDFKNYMKGE